MEGYSLKRMSDANALIKLIVPVFLFSFTNLKEEMNGHTAK